MFAKQYNVSYGHSLGLLCLGLHMLPGPRCLFPYWSGKFLTITSLNNHVPLPPFSLYSPPGTHYNDMINDSM